MQGVCLSHRLSYAAWWAVLYGPMPGDCKGGGEDCWTRSAGSAAAWAAVIGSLDEVWSHLRYVLCMFGKHWATTWRTCICLQTVFELPRTSCKTHLVLCSLAVLQTYFIQSCSLNKKIFLAMDFRRTTFVVGYVVLQYVVLLWLVVWSMLSYSIASSCHLLCGSSIKSVSPPTCWYRGETDHGACYFERKQSVYWPTMARTGGMGSWWLPRKKWSAYPRPRHLHVISGCLQGGA